MPDASYDGQAKVYRKQGGAEMVVASGGLINLEEGSGIKGPAATVAATKTVTAAESGTTFFLSHATEFVTTLPSPAAGLRYTFIVANAPETASYTIVATTAIILGHVVSSDLDAAGDAGSEASGCTTITLVDSKAVVGDRVDLECDGTNWFARCSCKAFDAITLSGS